MPIRAWVSCELPTCRTLNARSTHAQPRIDASQRRKLIAPVATAGSSVPGRTRRTGLPMRRRPPMPVFLCSFPKRNAQLPLQCIPMWSVKIQRSSSCEVTYVLSEVDLAVQGHKGPAAAGGGRPVEAGGHHEAGLPAGRRPGRPPRRPGSSPRPSARGAGRRRRPRRSASAPVARACALGGLASLLRCPRTEPISSTLGSRILVGGCMCVRIWV